MAQGTNMRNLFYSAFNNFVAMEGSNLRNGVSERNPSHRLGVDLEDQRRRWGSTIISLV
jgi:hypothetical protein